MSERNSTVCSDHIKIQAEYELVRLVREKFKAKRHKSMNPLFIPSVSAVRLQNEVRDLCPDAYNRFIVNGRWCGKWHIFLHEALYLTCFTYTAGDYEAMPGLATLVLPGELRCRYSWESPKGVRDSDARIGQLLKEGLMDVAKMRTFCIKFVDEEENFDYHRPRFWTPRAPQLLQMVRLLSLPEGSKSIPEKMKRDAVGELTRIILRQHPVMQNVSFRRIRSLLMSCVREWNETTFCSSSVKGESVTISG